MTDAWSERSENVGSGDLAGGAGGAEGQAPRGINIVHVGDWRWASFHVFCPADRDALLMQVIQPVVAEVWSEGLADQFFFIRYPEGGDHVRLRLRIAAGIDTARATDRAFARLRARCAELDRARGGTPEQRISVVPAVLELEIDRYGGPRWFPCALSFFALSSIEALRFVAAWRPEPRARQLIEILTRLARQAIGMARTVEELRGLADYVAQSRPRMAPILARADQLFERSGPELTRRIHAMIVAAAAPIASAPGSPEAHVVHARGLSAAVEGLEGEARWRALGSQMHMAANRLGLSPPEESYLSAILCRCLDALGGELADLMAAAVRAGALALDPADALDAQVAGEMHALFSRRADHVCGAAPDGAT
jgi:thiopeptide-type bacteriocin biosynthesis protein